MNNISIPLFMIPLVAILLMLAPSRHSFGQQQGRINGDEVIIEKVGGIRKVNGELPILMGLETTWVNEQRPQSIYLFPDDDSLSISHPNVKWSSSVKKIFAGAKDMNPEDLRVGQRLLINFWQGIIEIIDTPTIQTKILRYKIKIIGERINANSPLDTASICGKIRLILSWLLPTDARFGSPGVSLPDAKEVGQVNVVYKFKEREAKWMHRSHSIEEILDIRTLLFDPNLISTWNCVISKGGLWPGNSARINDVNFKSVFENVPKFLISKIQ